MSFARRAVTRMILDMGKVDIQKSVAFTKGDVNRRWEVTLIDNGVPFEIPNNWTVALSAVKPDETSIYNGCVVDNGKIIYDFASGEQIATSEGTFPAQFDIFDETGEVVCSPGVWINILPVARNVADIESDPQFTIIRQFLEKIGEVNEDIDDLEKRLGEVITAGFLSIPIGQWAGEPPMATLTIPGMGKNTATLLFPANGVTRKEATVSGAEAEVAEDGLVTVCCQTTPSYELTFVYVVLKDEREGEAVRAISIVGVSTGDGAPGFLSSVDDGAGNVTLFGEFMEAVDEGARAETKKVEEALSLAIKKLYDILDSDDETMDEMREIVATIKSNKNLINAIITGKVNVTDIVNNLVTNVSNKPLSAAQGVVLKGLIDDLQAAVQIANTNLAAHNVNTEAHADLRIELEKLADWVKDLLDSDDETLNEMHEIVAVIKSNQTLIEAITTSKVNVKDIVNDLVTNVTNRPLSAAQGVALKQLIDELEIALEEATKENGIHIGPDEPTDGSLLWVDTDEQPDEDEGAGTAAPQPDWNASEGTDGHILNRTHYVDEKGVIHKLDNKFIDAEWMATSEDGGAGKTVFIPEQTVANSLWSNLQGTLVEGTVYAVEVNGILYRCECRSYDGTLYLGNGSLFGDTTTAHNNEPFCIAWFSGATGGAFYNDGTLEAPIGIKVTDWVDTVYNQMPEEFLPDSAVRGDENGVLSWNALSDRPISGDVGELLFSKTVTFDTDDGAARLTGVSLSLTNGAEYWLEINGEMVKCHCEVANTLYDAEGNIRMKGALTTWYLYGQTAGTYTYNLYKSSEDIVLDPQYIPGNIARKYDIPDAVVNPATASVGQTIIVEEVDESGKPTKWESAEYQPRTHYETEVFYLPETTITEFVDGGAITTGDMLLQDGETYKVTYNGTVYECQAKYNSDMDAVSFNADAMSDGVGTGEPFIIMSIADDEGYLYAVMPLDGSASVTVSITGKGAVKIPDKYIDHTPFDASMDEKIAGATDTIVNTAVERLTSPAYIDLSSIGGGIPETGTIVSIPEDLAEDIYLKFFRYSNYFNPKVYAKCVVGSVEYRSIDLQCVNLGGAYTAVGFIWLGQQSGVVTHGILQIRSLSSTACTVQLIKLNTNVTEA